MRSARLIMLPGICPCSLITALPPYMTAQRAIILLLAFSSNECE
ncbi:hypothetical protein CES85_2086 [Ochrobactrum quorumnocens]|uniref:Uncharacterized protein n=1 Tax=Ochrobactrum quorumnocens TaxID=271865 RepID=A0A248ULC7_9HYPH|nr:hypothetical protein CES85_2086 [[Ochrobactrum] quorumnocens]